MRMTRTSKSIVRIVIMVGVVVALLEDTRPPMNIDLWKIEGGEDTATAECVRLTFFDYDNI